MAIYNKYSLRLRKTLYRYIQKIGIFLLGDFRLTGNSLDWMSDESFNIYLGKFNEFGRFNSFRRWNLLQLLKFTENIDGDTAECGVFTGASSWLICNNNANNSNKKNHHLFDSFQGLSNPTLFDGDHWKKGDLKSSVDIVKTNLAEFSNVSFHPGWIPDRFSDVDTLKFSFVHIDLDLYKPTFDSIAFFYDRLSKGGILLCDDYGFSTCPGSTKAMNEFLADKKEKIIAFASGGAFIIKE